MVLGDEAHRARRLAGLVDHEIGNDGTELGECVAHGFVVADETDETALRLKRCDVARHSPAPPQVGAVLVRAQSIRFYEVCFTATWRPRDNCRSVRSTKWFRSRRDMQLSRFAQSP
jgi:hypothetical protein